MGCLAISSEHVANFIDKVVEDAKNGMGFRFYDLACVLDAIAEAQDDPTLHVLPQAVRGFGNLITSRALIALPVLPDPIRTHLTALINTAVDEAVSSLNINKEQLCLNHDPDHKTLMKAIGSLFKQGNILAKESRAISSRRQASPSIRVEE
jgi:hypothetical protein